MGFEFEQRKKGVGTDLEWALLRTPITAYMMMGSSKRETPEEEAERREKERIEDVMREISSHKSTVALYNSLVGKGEVEPDEADLAWPDKRVVVLREKLEQLPRESQGAQRAYESGLRQAQLFDEFRELTPIARLDKLEGRLKGATRRLADKEKYFREQKNYESSSFNKIRLAEVEAEKEEFDTIISELTDWASKHTEYQTRVQQAIDDAKSKHEEVIRTTRPKFEVEMEALDEAGLRKALSEREWLTDYHLGRLVGAGTDRQSEEESLALHYKKIGFIKNRLETFQ